MNIQSNYDGNYIMVKGRMTSGIQTYADVGACNIALDQGGLLSTPAKVDFASSSAQDADGGTGLITALLFGLGTDGLYQEETITLEGTSKKTSTKDWYRLFGLIGLTCGTSLANVGDIYVTKTGTGGTWSGGVPPTFTDVSALCKAPAAAGLGLTCFYTTPNKSGSWQAVELQVSARAQSGTVMIQVRDWQNLTPTVRVYYIDLPAGGAYTVDLRKYKITVGKKTDIRVMAAGASAGMVCHAALAIEGK